MTIDSIRSIVIKLKRKYPNMTAEEICHAEDIRIYYKSLGNRPEDTKGFFTLINRIKSIIINDDLPEWLQYIVLLHELGHAILHGKVAPQHMFHDTAFFDEAGAYEFEANIFAAEFSMTDEAVLEVLNGDTSFQTAAAILGVPPELLDFKFRILKRQGYKLNTPIVSNSRFMRNIDRPNRF